MKRNTVIALGVGVLVVSILGFVLYRRSKNTTSDTLLGGGVPVYVPGGPMAGPTGPPSPASNKISNTFQNINNTVQNGLEVAMSGKKTWDDVKSFFG